MIKSNKILEAVHSLCAAITTQALNMHGRKDHKAMYVESWIKEERDNIIESRYKLKKLLEEV